MCGEAACAAAVAVASRGGGSVGGVGGGSAVVRAGAEEVCAVLRWPPLPACQLHTNAARCRCTYRNCLSSGSNYSSSRSGSVLHDHVPGSVRGAW